MRSCDAPALEQVLEGFADDALPLRSGNFPQIRELVQVLLNKNLAHGGSIILRNVPQNQNFREAMLRCLTRGVTDFIYQKSDRESDCRSVGNRQRDEQRQI